MIYTSEYLSPIGPLLLAEKEGTLIGLWKKGQKYYGSTLKGETAEKPDSPTLLRTKQWLDRYFGKENPAIEDLPLAPEGSDFRKAVWNILRTVPYGETTTYGEITRKLAAKQRSDCVSARAVGNAIGHNPILIILPCHRVIGANGNLTGYAGGIETKIRLLALEGIDATQFKAPKKNVKP